MKIKIFKYFAIVSLIVIVSISFMQFFGFIDFIIFSYKNDKKYKEINEKFQQNQVEYHNLERLHENIKQKKYKTAIAQIDSQQIYNNVNYDLLLKRGYLHLLIGNNDAAIKEFNFIKNSNSKKCGDIIILSHKEIYFYSIIGEAIAKNNIDTSIFNQYQIQKDKC